MHANTAPLLTQLHTDIDQRVAAIRAAHPDWLCAKGCGGCCQRLAAIPQLTRAEWDFLREGLLALPEATLTALRTRMATLAAAPTRPVVCPLLDAETQACPVYAQRPVACRTYGFYTQRDGGIYCQEILAQVETGGLDDVIWGNQTAVDRQLASLGETRTLTEWFAQDFPPP